MKSHLVTLLHFLAKDKVKDINNLEIRSRDQNIAKHMFLLCSVEL